MATLKRKSWDRYAKRQAAQRAAAADEMFEKYGSWEMVLVKALGTNAGMDACLGFYDEYWYIYDLEQEEEPEEDPAE